jgi:hypothetical protein
MRWSAFPNLVITLTRCTDVDVRLLIVVRTLHRS